MQTLMIVAVVILTLVLNHSGACVGNYTDEGGYPLSWNDRRDMRKAKGAVDGASKTVTFKVPTPRLNPVGAPGWEGYCRRRV